MNIHLVQNSVNAIFPSPKICIMWGPGVFCWSNRGWKKYLKQPPQWNSVLISYLILQDGNWLLPQWLFHKLLKIFHHVGFQSPMKTPRRGCRPLQDTDVLDLFFYFFLDPYLMSGNLKGHLKKRRSKNELEEEKLECISWLFS